MANAYYSDIAPKQLTNKKEKKHGAMGMSPTLSMPIKTANWPGVPGKTQKNMRHGGAATKGYCGADFYVKKEGL